MARSKVTAATRPTARTNAPVLRLIASTAGQEMDCFARHPWELHECGHRLSAPWSAGSLGASGAGPNAQIKRQAADFPTQFNGPCERRKAKRGTNRRLVPRRWIQRKAGLRRGRGRDRFGDAARGCRFESKTVARFRLGAGAPQVAAAGSPLLPRRSATSAGTKRRVDGRPPWRRHLPPETPRGTAQPLPCGRILTDLSQWP